MVAHIPAVVEWHFSPASSSTYPLHLFRCLRSWGCGAREGSSWFRISWPVAWAHTHIAPKELVPIVVAIALWGHKWRGNKICCYCDNAAVVFAVNKGSARDPQLMRLLRSLFFLCATYDISISARHIAGVLNKSAGALSRNNLPLFFTINPQAQAQPTAVPDELLELVFNRNLLWTSPNWTNLFATILASVLPPPRERPMPQPSATSNHFARQHQ